MPLDAYRAKRKFSKTPEPTGGLDTGGDPIFVVQQHHASHMHYDLRLQIGDTLKSWAVPQGPSLDPKVRRFAKHVEDHPLDYANFEGRIPDGNYGAGNMIVWDRGTWVSVEEDALAALAAGELKFRLAGQKLTGGFTLVRLPEDPTNFLLIKERDMSARPIADYDVLKEEPNSVITGLPVDAPPPEDDRQKKKKTAAKPKAERLSGAKAAPMPKTWSPQLAGSADAPPKSSGWIHEIKHDGYRTLVFFDHGKVKLITRNGHDWTKRYGYLAQAFEKLPCKTAILDGEVVVQDARGVSSLNLLEQALSEGETHNLTYYAFDLVYLDGHDLSGMKLIDRKHALEGLVAPLTDDRSALQFSTHIEGDGAELFENASRMGLEGIVSKKADARYVQRRSDSWLKVKRVDIGKFVIIGYLSSIPKTVTSLILADEHDGEITYAGRAGSGIGEEMGRALYEDFSQSERKTPVAPVPKTPGAKFLEPDFIAEIGYRGRSLDDAPRAPVVMDVERRAAKPRKMVRQKLVGDRDLAAIQLTNPEREMFAGSGVTKLDIALYYARIADWLLPEMLRRPVTIVRCPSGAIEDCFYQRHSFAGLPDGVETIQLADEEGRAAFITVTKPKGYLALAQFGAVEYHLWGCRIDDPEHPDRIVIDLDPDPKLPFARICDAAELLKGKLEKLGFTPFLRTTGGKGLHLVVALKQEHDWPLVKGFAEAFARAASQDWPSLFTANPQKEARRNKIYVDYLRNARGASAIASYSLRARPAFPCSVPIRWDELRGLSGGNAFTRLNVFRRMETLAADPWDGLESSALTISPAMRRELGMK